jgi:competence protein ComEA
MLVYLLVLALGDAKPLTPSKACSVVDSTVNAPVDDQVCACPQEIAHTQASPPTTNDHRSCSEETTADKPRKRPKKPKPPRVLKLNLLQANAQQLEWLPKVGPATAQRILEYRQRRPKMRIQDLTKIKGFGKKTLDLLRPLLIREGSSWVCPATCPAADAAVNAPSTNGESKAERESPAPTDAAGISQAPPASELAPSEQARTGD